MFRDDQLMVLTLERFEGETTPGRPAVPKVHDDREVSDSSEEMGIFSLVASEGPHDDLADLGLVMTSRYRDDLAILGLARLSTPRPRRFGV